MGRIRAWVRRDLAKVIGFRRVAKMIGRRPQLLLWLVFYLVVTYGLLFAVLALIGQLDQFDRFGIIPALLSGGLLGGRLQALREEDAENS